MAAPPISRRHALPALALFAAVGAVAAGLTGQDAGFDLRNYHWYDAWAALHGRLGVDVAPAQLQTFFNPALDLVYYGLLTTLGAAAGTIAMGALHGVMPGLACLLSWRLLPPATGRLPLALLCGASAAYAPVFAAGVGTAQGDLLVGALVLAGVLSLLGPPDRSDRNALVWGALTGMALGLKPTASAFVLAGLPLVILRGGRSGLARAFTGGLLGWAVAGGVWAGVLAVRFDSPVFPMANDLFQSDWAAHDHFFDQGYFPSGADWVLLPVRIAIGGEHAWFYSWRDARLLVLLLVGGAWAMRRRDDPDVTHLLLWAAIAYLVWLRSSAMIRYLAPLEAAAPALLVACVARLLPRRGFAVGATALLALALWQELPDYERVGFSDPPLGVVLPPLPSGPAPTVVSAGDAANSYIAPSFPPQWRHVRVVSSVLWHEDQTLLHAAAAQVLREADPVLLLTGQEGEVQAEALRSFGLRADLSRCLPVLSPLDEGIVLCEVSRLP
ncbi:MAG: hypothetical protein KDA24_23115 [Deltaproteobacteria bacterium]|nr:hypothetical protein [Deltaproteobacteria bacterium]